MSHFPILPVNLQGTVVRLHPQAERNVLITQMHCKNRELDLKYQYVHRTPDEQVVFRFHSKFCFFSGFFAGLLL